MVCIEFHWESRKHGQLVILFSYFVCLKASAIHQWTEEKSIIAIPNSLLYDKVKVEEDIYSYSKVASEIYVAI